MGIAARIREDEELRTLCLTAFSGIALAASFLELPPRPPFDPAWAAIAVSGAPIVYGAIRGLVLEFDVTADLLVAIALVAALAVGEPFAAGEVAFIMQLGKVLEDRTAGKTRKSLQALVALSPRKARLLAPEGEREVLAAELRLGDILVVRPGESIPVDGTIVRGSGSIDQSAMTGESVPVERGAGDELFQGTLNLQGAIEMRATKLGEDSSLGRMIKLVEEAERNKAPVVRVADRWARILVPVALGCSAAIWLITKDAYRAVAALVVFCPCSLILATPTAVMAAIGNATKHGILIKSGAAVEAAARIDTLVLDKTGTLTRGRLRVEEVGLLDPGMDLPALARLAASAEKYSEHPAGKAIVAYARSLGICAENPDSFEMLAGKGVVAAVGGREVRLGEKAVGRDPLGWDAGAASLAERMRRQGKTVLPVALDGRIVGIIAIADSIREEARDAVERLRKAGLSRIAMLTGDNRAVAESIAREAGIVEVHASLLPEGKVEAIGEIARGGRRVAMLGDGVNDAPALAAASVGIAMGAMGSDAAMEAADIALMSDDLGKLPFLVSLCRKARRRIAFDIAVSMCINASAIVLAGLGSLSPVAAALVHNCGSVFVVVHSAMLLGYEERRGFPRADRGRAERRRRRTDAGSAAP